MLKPVRLFDTIPTYENTSNAPTGTGQQPQYFARATQMHIQKMARYATDFFGAQVQGLNSDDPEEKNWYEIRAADVFSSLGIHSGSKQDDWKNIYFKRPDIDYIPPGTKFWFWNNVWLADNPSNIASVSGNALVRRCNAVWNSLDFYGNIVSEPFVLTNIATKANANTDNEFMQLADAYSDCIMQANEWALENLRENTRIVLGSGVYAVRGLADYIREFTEDSTSVRLLHFSVYYQEPVDTDDMSAQVANGLAFRWEIIADAPRTIQIGVPTTLIPTSIRNGEVVVSTDTQPISYLWESLDADIATVDNMGTVTAMTAGQVTIQCSLEQNQDIQARFVFEVTDTPSLSWASSVPEKIPQFTSATLLTNMAVSWNISGGTQNSFEVSQTETSLTIQCFYPSTTPLTITATSQTSNDTLSAVIDLTVR